MEWRFIIGSLLTNWYMSYMLTSSIILISVVEQTGFIGVTVHMDDSILRRAYEIAEYVIIEVMPHIAIIIVSLVIIILMVELISRLFR